MQGIVAASVLLDKYQEFLNRYVLPPEVRVSFVDHAGKRMFTFPDSGAFPLGRPIDAALFLAVAQQPADNGVFSGPRLGGESGLFGYARLHLDADTSPYVFILAAFSRDAAFEPARKMLIRNLLLAVLAALAAVVLALFIGDRAVLRGLEGLMGAVGRFGGNDLTARAPTEAGSREVRQLGHAFNDMARQLEESSRQLRATRSMLNNILESMPSAIIGLDSRQQVTHWSSGAEKLLGLPPEEALGRPFGEVQEWLARTIGQACPRGRVESPLVLEKQSLPGQEEQRYVDVLAYPLHANGIQGAVVRVDDVTARVTMEELLLRSEKMSSVGNLAAGMAHEINNPLSGILQSIQNIRRRIAPGLPANDQAARESGCDLASMRDYLTRRGILDFLDSVQESGNRAARIVKNMLGFIRKSSSARLPVNLAELVDRTVDIASTDYDLKKKYDFRKIAIERQYAPDMPLVPCSASEIEQVVFNLLGNAAQAMATQPEPRPDPRLVLRVHATDSHAVLEVEDNGPGMPEHVRKRVFEPLFSTKPPGQGTGLGLSVAYFVVTNTHGGVIDVVSRPGQGARFVIRLPLAPGPAYAPGSAEAPPA